jgi:hypothetical protein
LRPGDSTLAQNQHAVTKLHMSSPPDEARANFEYLSNEYAQALQAYQTIETQASTLTLLGYTDDLRIFIEQFIEMATNAKVQAIERNEPNFAEWFGELIRKAEELRAASN